MSVDALISFLDHMIMHPDDYIDLIQLRKDYETETEDGGST